MSTSETKVQRLEKELADQEQALAASKKALLAAGAPLDDYEKQRTAIKNEQATRVAAFNNAHSQKLKAMAENTDHLFTNTSGAENNCLLFSLQKNDGFTAINVPAIRKNLYKWYDVIFADSFPGNITPDVAKQFNADFRVGSTISLTEVKAALEALHTALRGRGAIQDWGSDPRPANFNKASHQELRDLFHDKAPSTRMLNAADALLLAALMKREIILIASQTGVANHLNPQDILGPQFSVESSKSPAFIQHDGKVHFQGLNAKGKKRYNELVAENKENEKKVAVAEATDNAALQAEEANICNGKDPNFKKNFNEYKRLLKQIPSTKINLESARKNVASSAPSAPTPRAAPLGTSVPVPAKPASIPVTPSLASQISALQKMQEALDKEIAALPKTAAVPADFGAGLRDLHDKRGKTIKKLAAAKIGETKKTELKTLMANPKSFNPLETGADRSSSLFHAIKIKGSNHKKLLDLMNNGRNNLNTLDINEFMMKKSGLMQAQEDLAEYANDLEQYEDIKKQSEELTSNAKAKLKSEKDKNKKLKITDKVNQALDALAAGRPAAFMNKSDDEIAALKVTLEKNLEVKRNNTELMAKAYQNLFDRLQVLREQQDNASGDVLNPYDVQWAAIIRRHDIVVVKADGTEVTYSRELFSEEDLRGIDPALDKDERSKLSKDYLDALKVLYSSNDKDPKYVFDDETNGVYQNIATDTHKAIVDLRQNTTDAISNEENALKTADTAIVTYLGGLNGKVSPLLQAQAKKYSDTLAALADGKPLGEVLPSVPAPTQHAWEAKLDSIAAGNVVTVTADADDMRAVHRQNIDVLLALMLQGTPADRIAFYTDYKGKGPVNTVLNLTVNGVPMFYAKGLTKPDFTALTSKDEPDSRIVELIEKEINAYLQLKKATPNSALAQDYAAILSAIEMKGLNDIPNSLLKPLLEGIHERVAAKAQHVANIIDHNAHKDIYGRAFTGLIRGGLHDYRQAVAKVASPPAFNLATAPVPKPAHAVKQTTYMPSTGKPPRVVFDIKGMTIDEVMNAFNAKIEARDIALTVKNDKNEDRRIVADLDPKTGRIKLVLQDISGNNEMLTTNVWAKAAENVQKVINEIADVDQANEYSKPRKRGP